MQRLRSERGFTLIEMMVVLAIIALIAVFAIPSIVDALQNSRIKVVEAQARQIQTAMDQYYNDNQTYPDAADPLAADEATAYLALLGTGGVLVDYITMPADLASAPFVLRSYAQVSGVAVSEAEYEILLDVRNVTTDERFIHITPSSVSRDSTSTVAATPPGGEAAWNDDIWTAP